ncbi:hypothetical protein FI667_g17252, partial [Globisporangium splendens]
MIIRAVSSDEDDDDNEQQEAGSSMIGSGGTGPVGRDGVFHSAKIVWIATTLALVVLVLVDIAGVMNQFQQQQPIDAENESARDVFALIPILIAWWSRSGSVLASLYAAPATSVNSVVGSLVVAGWIYSREQSKNARRYRAAQWRSEGSSGPSASCRTSGSPWLPIAGLFCFGHVVSCMYILMALFESNGDRRVFFLGKASNSRTYPSV